MPAHTLVLGLDGADPDLIEALGPAVLPNLFLHRERGAYARLRSVIPPATLPNWTTFLTGMDPGQHGVFDFTTRVGDKVAFTGGTVREVPTIAARLGVLGRSSLMFGFPGTYPPERLPSGIFVSGWDSPVAFEADRSFVWPPEYWNELRRRHGRLRFDDVDELAADRPGFHDVLASKLIERIERKVHITRELLTEHTFDFAAIYFGESDTAAHHLWAHHDLHSPRRPLEVSAAAQAGLTDVYRALDRAVGRLVEACGPAVELTIVSDHGSGGASDRVLYLNRALAQAGFLHERSRRWTGRAVARMKDIGMRVTPSFARDALFRVAGRALPGWIESRARFGTIDFTRTRVFSDELNYFPALHVNLRGREPHGIVEASELPTLHQELEQFADALRDPFSGTRIIERIHRREDLFSGPHIERAPDFLLELALPEGYSYNVMPSGSAPSATGFIRRLEVHERIGRKGRSLAGSHRARGIWIASGPSVRAKGEVDARIADATATLLVRMGIEVPHEFSGRVLREVLFPDRGSRVRLPGAPHEAQHQRGASMTEARLRALGYVD